MSTYQKNTINQQLNKKNPVKDATKLSSRSKSTNRLNFIENVMQILSKTITCSLHALDYHILLNYLVT